jgi:sugar-specific transcriptional regulator TrmB
MKPISNELIESLKTLGLTEYEAKVYSALVMFDRAEVKQIYEYLDAPKPSVYQSLRSLTDKGLVQVVNAKPAIYRATPPKIAISHMMDAHKKAEGTALRDLEELEKNRVESDYPDVLWTLYGDENVEHKIEELLGKARKSVKLLLPDEFLHYLELLREKDIVVDLIVFGDSSKTVARRYGLKRARVHNAFNMDLSDLAPLMRYLREIPLPADRIDKFIMVSVDDEEFMYIPPIPYQTKSGITSRNPFVLSLSSVIFSIIRDHTS